MVERESPGSFPHSRPTDQQVNWCGGDWDWYMGNPLTKHQITDAPNLQAEEGFLGPCFGYAGRKPSRICMGMYSMGSCVAKRIPDFLGWEEDRPRRLELHQEAGILAGFAGVALRIADLSRGTSRTSCHSDNHRGNEMPSSLTLRDSLQIFVGQFPFFLRQPPKGHVLVCRRILRKASQTREMRRGQLMVSDWKSCMLKWSAPTSQTQPASQASQPCSQPTNQPRNPHPTQPNQAS